MSEQYATTSLTTLLRQLKSQPGKIAVLAILLAVMVGLWVKHFAGGGVPSAAAAATPTPARDIRARAPATDNLPRAAAAMRDFLARPPAPVAKNLFVVNLDHFPLDPSKSPGKAQASGGGFWDELTKSLAAKADQEKARRILVENLQQQAAKLKVQGTLQSNGSPRAIVDGKFVGEGDVVAGFSILRIEANRIIVERDGVKFEVRAGFNQ